MSLEVRPRGVECNLRCRYCYEDAARETGHGTAYDKTVLLPLLENTPNFWSLFGGEALLLPLADLEELLALGHRKFGRTGVQTNGSLITDRHLELFVQYKTHVGFSIDGPGELNDIRWAGTLQGTRKMTARSEAAFDTMLDGVSTGLYNAPSLIVTLHTGNIGTPDRVDQLIGWFRKLDEKGLLDLNLHLMELDAQAPEWAVPVSQTLEFLRKLWALTPTFKSMRIKLFREILDLLKGHDENAVCTWHACDPWNTGAVQGVDGNGDPSGCTRTCKDGTLWLPASGTGAPTQHGIGGLGGNRFHERQLSLYVTPQEDGGCKDCRFWMMCLGQCPGGGLAEKAGEGDWRLRSSDCEIWKGLFEEGERRLLAVDEKPVSLYPNRRALEAKMFKEWAGGGGPSLREILSPAPKCGSTTEINGPQNEPHGDHHGDHYDLTDKVMRESHGDILHGDKHGDHTDMGSIH